MLLICVNSEEGQALKNNAYSQRTTTSGQCFAHPNLKKFRRASYSRSLFQVLLILCIISTFSTLMLLLLTRSEVKTDLRFQNYVLQRQLVFNQFIYEPTFASTNSTLTATELWPLSKQFHDRNEHANNYCQCRLSKASACSKNSFPNTPLALRSQKLSWSHSLTSDPTQHKNWIHFKPKASNNSYHRPSISWCPIFKAASTPWMAMFGRLNEILTPHTESRIKSGQSTFVKLFKDFRLNIPPSRQQTNIYKMLIVRHPFERLLSAYRDKLERVAGREFYQRKYGRKIIERIRYANQFVNDSSELLSPSQRFHSALSRVLKDRKSFETTLHPLTGNAPSIPILYSPPTFPEFVQYLIRRDPRLMDEHWRPMYLDCSPCNTHFDLILKVETMTADREAVIDLLGYGKSQLMPELNRIWRRWTNEAKVFAFSNKTVHYFSQITKSEMEALYSIYEPDFLLFNYKADTYFDIAI